MAIIQRAEKEVLQRMWREEKLCTLLVGMYTGAASMENSTKAPHGLRTNYHTTSGYSSRENEKILI